MDLDPAVEEEERQLEDHNEAMDARQALMGVGVTHLDPIKLEDFLGLTPRAHQHLPLPLLVAAQGRDPKFGTISTS
jgi:hypothetical protein